MRNKNNNYELFFLNLFPRIILKNEVVATILHVVGLKMQAAKDKIDNHFNTDI